MLHGLGTLTYSTLQPDEAWPCVSDQQMGMASGEHNTTWGAIGMGSHPVGSHWDGVPLREEPLG